MKQLERIIKEELLRAPSNVCASLYVPAGSAKQKCDDLRELIVETSNLLKTVYSGAEVEAFIKPLANFSKADAENFDQAIAFFRTMGTFKVMGLPINAQKECFVSNHFHIKPLLKWVQEEREFFCLNFSRTTVDVLKGDLNSFRAPGCFNLGPDSVKEIEACVAESSEEGKNALVFLSGNVSLAKKFLSQTTLSHVDPSVIERGIYRGDYAKLWEVLNERIRRAAVLRVKRSLLDYNIALMDGLGRSELGEIIKAAKEGSIKKLIVSEEDQIWGRFDAHKNNVNRMNKQINYEDDDLLDSISEKVIEKGGEVVMASKKLLPKNKPLLAILDQKAS